MTTSHPFDEALRLAAAGSDSPGTWLGHTSPEYWNMVGPFGGTTAATALRAILLHPALLGEPVALTVNYAAALVEGPFTLTAKPVRTNRSTQHWAVELSQADANGDAGVVMTATAVTAARRETWSQNDTPMPTVAQADDSSRLKVFSVAWTNRYDMRPVRGVIPQVWDGSGVDSLTQLWVRDDPPRPLDFPSLAAMADVFYPRVWLRRAIRVPAGTVSITTYFHADSKQLAQCGDGFLLGQARAQAFRNGFFDQTAQLWSEAGVLLATSTQVVYYKE
jgi:acyl-CoA thioesterase